MDNFVHFLRSSSIGSQFNLRKVRLNFSSHDLKFQLNFSLSDGFNFRLGLISNHVIRLLIDLFLHFFNITSILLFFSFSSRQIWLSLTLNPLTLFSFSFFLYFIKDFVFYRTCDILHPCRSCLFIYLLFTIMVIIIHSFFFFLSNILLKISQMFVQILMFFKLK